MRAFRFRAAAALDARRRQEDAASAVFMRADSMWRAARTRVDQVLERRRHAVGAAAEAQQVGASAGDLEWHRNWISGLSAAADSLGHEAARLARLAREAEQAWQETRRRRLVLERMRERMWQRHQLAEGRQENKDIDELARLRYLAPATGLRRDDAP